MKTLQCDGGRDRLNRIMVILQKESRHNTHYDGPLKTAIAAYFKNKAVKQGMAKKIKANLPKARATMTKSVRRSLNVRAY
jgi:hypothetical protein